MRHHTLFLERDIVLVLLTVLAVGGCGSNSISSTASAQRGIADTASTQNSIADSWKRFISDAKSRKADAKSNYLERYKPATDLQVQWGVDEVVKTDSITAPYIGKVDLTILLTTKFGTGRFQYSLQFVPVGTGWQYRGGKKQRFDSSITDKDPLEYPNLEDEVRVLFSESNKSQSSEDRARIPGDSRLPEPQSSFSLISIPFAARQAKETQDSLAKSLGKSVVEKNTLGMELVLIPPGKFTMGSPANEKFHREDEQQVEVILSAPFWLGKTEVTQGQWEQIMGTTPWKGKKYAKEGSDYAATYVSWNDAQEFVKKLSERDEVTYRLPTEAEWEWSCRAGTSSAWSFGESDSELGKYGWYERLGEGNAKGEEYAHQVEKKLPNAFGLYDMHGNVSEWCEDVKTDNLPGGTNPKVIKGSKDRVLRGGSWLKHSIYSRSAMRFWDSPDGQDNDSEAGFRISKSQ